MEESEIRSCKNHVLHSNTIGKLITLRPQAKSNMKNLLLFMLFGIGNLVSTAQLSLQKFPRNLSVLPRDLKTNKATIEIEGQSTYNDIVLKKFKNGVIQFSRSLDLDSSSGLFKFQYSDFIRAGLSNYRYELWRGDSTLLAVADSICAGDVYILNGQSNAESRSTGEKTNYLKNAFIRTYGNASESPCIKKWFVASGDGTRDSAGHIGQLGMEIATKLMNERSIPICIMNGAVGGMEISYFLRDEANHQNMSTAYGRLLNRISDVDLTSHIRAIIWFQGEKDAGIGTTKSVYTNRLQSLYNSWHEDYPGFENMYLYQIRFGCWQADVYTRPIHQAQFEFALNHQDVIILSTNNVDQYIDSCHYNFQNGYRVLGDYAFEQMNHYQYDNSTTNGIRSLLPKQIHKINDYQIEIVLDNPIAVTADPGVEKYFFLSKTNEKPVKIEVNENRLTLSFQNLLTANNPLTYLGHPGNRFPSISDPHGHSLVCFDGLGDTNFDWHLVYQDVFPTHLEHSENPQEVQTLMKDGYYFYPAGRDLIIESSKNETCALEIELYNAAGIHLLTIKNAVIRGSNRYHLPLAKATFYMLNIKVKGKNSLAFKQLKMMY